MNEGHAGFLGLERIRELVAAGLSFHAAVEAVRGGGVFTTHTPVPAGIDRFPRELMEDYFTSFAKELGVSFDELFAIGERADEPDEKFNMAVMGLRLAARSNGVAKLHGAVSREMFQGLWPDLAVDEVPIGSITNGVHGRTWVSARVDALLSRVVGEDWHGADRERWSRILEVDPMEAWSTLNDGRDELVRLARQRLGEDVLDSSVLTIGFARRFATYKRATLLLSDPDRLRALLHDAERPVQFVFAGKAHPADNPGKQLIQRIEQFARTADVRHRFVFLADYDISIARAMYHGCDVWLNTPRRPLEACGTSGMKAALNGALNCSIRDGWWDECFDGSNGWAIESAEDDPDLDRRDHREVGSLFGILENQLVPRFYDRGRDGVPRQWVDMVLKAWASLGPEVTAARMVRDYTTALYEPAAASAIHLASDGGAPAAALAAWRERVDRGVGRRVDHVGRARRRSAAGRRVADRHGPRRPRRARRRRRRRAVRPRAHRPRRRVRQDRRRAADVDGARIRDVRRDDHHRRRRDARRDRPRHPRAPRPRQPVRRRPHRLGDLTRVLSFTTGPIGPVRKDRSAYLPVNVALPGPCSRKLATPVRLSSVWNTSTNASRSRAKPSASDPERPASTTRLVIAWATSGPRAISAPRLDRPLGRVAVDGLVGEPDADRLVDLDLAAREAQLLGPARPDEAGQALRPAAAGDDAEQDLGLPEDGPRPGDAVVARQRQLAPAAERVAGRRRR